MIYDHGPVFAMLVTFGPAVVIGLIATAVLAWRDRRRR